MAGTQHEADAAPETLNERSKANPQASAQLILLNQRAKARFLASHEGAIIERDTTLYNRSVIRYVKRSYMRGVMDWYLSTSLIASQLKDRDLSRKIEAAMLQKVEEVHKHFHGLNEKAKVIIDAAELDETCITHSTKHQEKLVMLGPVSLKVRNTLMLCDKYLDRVVLMYTMGEIDQKAHNDAQYDVKTKLEALATSLRSHRIRVLQLLREKGITREAYRGAVAAAEGMEAAAQANAVAGTSEPTGEVVPLVAQGSAGVETSTQQPLAAAA